jgi:hypothetical protein
MSLGDRDSDRLRQVRKRSLSLRVADTAAGDDERPLRGLDHLDRRRHLVPRRWAADDVPDALPEEMRREVEGLALYVLRQR